jgi:hypothetical protein
MSGGEGFSKTDGVDASKGKGSVEIGEKRIPVYKSFDLARFTS